MSKHTPGPWITGPVDDTLVRAVTDEGEYISIAEMCGNYNDVHARMEANARLIAAAPDLLAGLKHVVRWHDQLNHKDVARLEAIISKAEASS